MCFFIYFQERFQIVYDHKVQRISLDGRPKGMEMDKPTYYVSLFLFNFQVGDNSFDLPEANVLIQVKCAQLIMSIEFKLRH